MNTYLKVTSRLVSTLAILMLFACGGGGGGASGVTPNPGSSGPVIEGFISDFVLEPATHITPAGSNLYVGTNMGLVEINESTGSKRSIAGNTNILLASGIQGVQMNYAGVISGSIAYMGIRNGRIGSVSLAQDNNTALEIIVPQRALADTANFSAIGANLTHTFWTGVGNPIVIFSQPHGQPRSIQPILSVPGAYAELTASEGVVYLYVDGGGAAPNNFRRVYRYITATGQSTLLYDQPRATSDITTDLPIASDANGVYWANGSEVLFAGNGSSSGQVVTTLVDRVISLVADSGDLYVYHIENYALIVPNPTSRRVITKVTTSPVTTTELVRLVYDTTDAPVFTVYSGQLYFAVHEYSGSAGATTLYHRNSAGSFDALVNVTQDYGLSGVGGLVASNGKLALASGRLLLYDLNSTGVVDIWPATGTGRLLRSGTKIYMGGSVGIARLDLSLPLRQIQEINSSDPYGGFMPIGGTQAGGYVYLYGIYGADPATHWRIVKMLPNGSQYQTLIQGAGELRDPVVLRERLYFLCRADCGAPEWVLASIPVTGGTTTPEYLVYDKPRLYVYNNVLYLTGTPEGLTGNIFAIDVVTGNDALVLENIPYSQMSLTFSNSWLYWGGLQVLQNGAPARAIARHPWTSWSSVGSRQTIVEGIADTISNLGESTIAAGNNYTYYWHNGLKRVAH